MMTFFELHIKELISVLTPLAIWSLNYFLKEKAKLVHAKAHQFSFLIQEPLRDPNGILVNPSQTVNTISHLVSNCGKITTKKVEVTFNWKPMYLNIWPIRRFEEFVDKDNRYIMTFDTLTPKETITIELLAINNPLPELLSVKSEDCLGSAIKLQPQQVVAPWLIKIFVILITIGIATISYWFVSFIQHIAALSANA